MQPDTPPWLERYSNDHHAWKPIHINDCAAFMRPLGLVESSFDTDGVEYEGRADFASLLTLEINHTLPSQEAYRRRIALAWTSLRLQHVMLSSRIVQDENTGRRCFIVDVPDSVEGQVRKVQRDIVWVDDFYTQVESLDLYKHALNVGRIIDPKDCLSKFHVLPLIKLPNGHFELRFLTIMAHQISDGLSAYNWFSHFVRILNQAERAILQDIESFRHEAIIQKRLPPAQEDLYPKITGSKARQRWFWAIIRVLRHVRKTLPPTFTNPLRRAERLSKPLAFPPTFSHIFDYSEAKRPPLTGSYMAAILSSNASKRMLSLCRSMNVSIGAGCFALAALAFMELHEARFPHIPFTSRLPFTSGFPLNPRAFFGLTKPAESCMLAFCEGIVLPFLSSRLPVHARFRLTARAANRQLGMYQKRLRRQEVGGKGSMDPHSPGRLLATGYLNSIARADFLLPPQRRSGLNPQGALPAKVSPHGATVNISSVGSSAVFFRPGVYDVDAVGAGNGGKDFVADFRGMRQAVRARENEFLVGSASNAHGIVQYGVSYDLSAISEEAAEEWAEKIRGLLDGPEGPRL